MSRKEIGLKIIRKLDRIKLLTCDEASAILKRAQAGEFDKIKDSELSK